MNNAMTTDAYLSQIIKFERMIENKQSEIMRFRDIMTSITVEPKEDVVQTSADKDKLATFTARVVDDETEIIDLLTKRHDLIKQIETFSSDPDMYQILYCRYVAGMSINDARHKLFCSRSKVYDLYDKALREFEAVYGFKYIKKRQKRKNRTKKETFTN